MAFVICEVDADSTALAFALGGATVAVIGALAVRANLVSAASIAASAAVRGVHLRIGAERQRGSTRIIARGDLTLESAALALEPARALTTNFFFAADSGALSAVGTIEARVDAVLPAREQRAGTARLLSAYSAAGAAGIKLQRHAAGEREDRGEYSESQRFQHSHHLVNMQGEGGRKQDLLAERAGQPTLRLIVSQHPRANAPAARNDGEPVAEVCGINVHAKRVVDASAARAADRVAPDGATEHN